MTQARKHCPTSPRQAARRKAPIDGLLRPALFGALGDPTRARLLACLSKCARAASVGEVAQCCSVDLSVVSRHLKHLEREGVLEVTRRGRTVLYGVRYTELASALRALADAFDDCGRGVCSEGCGCASAGGPRG